MTQYPPSAGTMKKRPKSKWELYSREGLGKGLTPQSLAMATCPISVNGNFRNLLELFFELVTLNDVFRRYKYLAVPCDQDLGFATRGGRLISCLSHRGPSFRLLGNHCAFEPSRTNRNQNPGRGEIPNHNPVGR